MAEPIYLETGRKWSFAAGMDWPGWCRHAKGTADPVAALLAYADRYRAALALTDVMFDPPNASEGDAGEAGVEVVGVFEGNSGTEWGVPSVVPPGDHRPLDEGETDRLVAILQAAWLTFDMAAEAVHGYELQMGPRGGGRDLVGTVDHCLESDQAYLSKLGARRPDVGSDDWRELEAAMRERAIQTLRDRAAGRPIREPSKAQSLWLPRWYVRYAAWHTLHHAWDLEDRRLD